VDMKTIAKSSELGEVCTTSKKKEEKKPNGRGRLTSKWWARNRLFSGLRKNISYFHEARKENKKKATKSGNGETVTRKEGN